MVKSPEYVNEFYSCAYPMGFTEASLNDKPIVKPSSKSI